MASSWGNKLQAKLSVLLETSSKESLQTLAKWIGFNRKHAAAFAEVLKEAILRAPPGLQSVYLKMIHEVLMLERGSGKWDKLMDLRLTLGENVVLPVADKVGSSAKSTIQGIIKEWDEANVFGGPTLINQIRKQVSSSPTPTKEAATASPDKETEEASEQHESKDVDREDEKTSARETEASPAKEPPSTEDIQIDVEGKIESSTASSPAPKEIPSYDFESKGIPEEIVEAKEFLEPCRSIATLQIARDLRNDGAVQLSSLLSGLPEDIRRVCAKASESENDIEIPEEQARDFSKRTSEVLIDKDLEDQLQNIRTFRNIVQQQRKARQELIRLLTKSRCRFGANDAAAAFHEADRARGELKNRKQILVDAMELEGLNPEEDKSKATDEKIEDLAPLSWYNPDAPPEAKKARTD